MGLSYIAREAEEGALIVFLSFCLFGCCWLSRLRSSKQDSPAVVWPLFFVLWLLRFGAPNTSSAQCKVRTHGIGAHPDQ